MRSAKVVAQAKQGQWLNRKNVEKRKLAWGDLWVKEESCIKFHVGTCTMHYQELRT